ncbi:hypothetical protein FPRO03_08330 [Fusarium proliferatum]|nr:hypothetical protein FPRO03_08330 [Fusarium proliferatum]
MATQTQDIEREFSRDEKSGIMHNEHAQGGLSQEDADFLNNFPEERKKAIIRKVDWRLIPMLVLLYLIAYLDKTNIGNAKIEGMTVDLHLKGIEYNIVTAIFFIPFVLCEVPSNMILHKFKRPSWYMGGIVFCWGVIMTLTALVQNYAGLLAIRFLLGIFEAGFLPGAILIISNWYLPNETQTRIAILYTSAATGGAFSGLLAFAIAKMDGMAGLEGWRWIFLIEGLFTVVVAIMCVFLLCDSPALSTRWLDADEIRYLELRQLARRATVPMDYKENDHFNLRLFKDILMDYKIWLLFFANWSNAVPNYAMKFTMPTILTGMGYTSSDAQLMTIPPYAIGAISAYLFAIFADKYSWRAPFILGPQCCLVVAFIILFVKSSNIEDNIAVCYFAVCLACFGMYPILPGVNAWNVANTPDPAKRSVNIGLLVCVGNIGGLIGSYIYLAREAPRYPTGYGTSLAFGLAGVVAVLLLETLLKRGNAKKAKMTEEEIRQRYTDDDLVRMGEKSPLFKVLSSTATLLYISYFIHNLIAWLKIRPFLPKWGARVFIISLLIVQPYWVLETWANFQYHNHLGSRIFNTSRLLEPLFRDPWWVFTTIKLVLAINENYEFTIPGLIRTSPRFGIMLFSLFLSIVFLITDVIFMIAVSKRGGINPFWRLALVFKCASDVIFLDDFKSVLDRISESAMRKITTFEYRDHASPSINQHASVDFSSPNFQPKSSRFHSSSRAEMGSILHPVGSRDDGHYEFASNYSQASVEDGATRPWLEDDARRSSSHSPRRRGESQDNMITIQEDDTANEVEDIPMEPVRARTRNDQAR